MPDFPAPRPLPSVSMIWRIWQLVFPDCREITINGAAGLDWSKVATVVRDFYQLPLSGRLHSKLRTCIYEVMRIESETRNQENGKNNT